MVPGDPSHQRSLLAEGECELGPTGEAPLDQSEKFQDASEPDASVATVTTGDVGPSGPETWNRLGPVSTSSTAEPFEEFMEREWKLVVGLLYWLTRDWYAAEDLAQNAFAAAEHHWARVGGLEKPGAWVRKVAIHELRRWRRRGALEARALAQRFLNVYVEQVELPAEYAELWDAVAKLPRAQREVIVLHYQSDLGIAEIAEILRTSKGTVKSRLHYGRKTLAKWLGDVEGGSR
jgi:RNA polymerase sigma-70 factor (ECF subfamily)